MSKNQYDLIIIGAGPAGLTAALYGARAGMKTIVLERIMPGGYVATISYIENYPGFENGIKGIELANRMKAQAQRFGAEIIGTEVTLVKRKDSILTVGTSSTQYSTQALVIAAGTTHRKLGVPGEDRLRGRGISYCATCDGPLFKGKTIAVIGCGNSGLQEGRFLLNFVKDILFIETLSCVMAEPALQKPLVNESRAVFFVNHEILSINGEESVRSITVKDRKQDQEKTYTVEGVFIYAGLVPLSHTFKGFVDLDPSGFVKTDNRLQTNIPGVFAAGDIRSKTVRQIVTACGDGAIAAMNAYKYLESMKP